MSRIRDLIEEFATKLEDELKEELRNALAGVGLGLGASTSRKGSAKVSNGHTRGKGRGVKRDAASLEALGEKFLGFVAKHPGQRIEQINKELGTSTKDLQLPIRKLLAEGKLKAKGQKRSTTYTVGGGSAKTAKKSRSKK